MDEQSIKMLIQIAVDTAMNDVKDNIKELFSRMNTSERDISGIKTDLSYIKTGMDEVKGMVKDLTSKSGKRWDSLVTEAIKYLMLGCLGYFVAKITGK